MFPLTLTHLLWRMKNVHADSEIVSVSGGAEDLVSTRMLFSDVALRIEALAQCLRGGMGLLPDQAVLVLGWNDREHLEVLVAGAIAGGVVNSVNVRLGYEVISYLVKQLPPVAVVIDAKLFDDPAVTSDIDQVIRDLDSLGIPIIAYNDNKPPSCIGAVQSYEQLLEENAGKTLDWTVGDENTTAFIFHTSGSTGRPKSYHVSHRAAMLHCLSEATVDASALSAKDRVLPLAPFFHVNGWGLPLTSLLTGASQVLIGGDLGAARVARILEGQRVTISAAVPTVWHDVCRVVKEGEAKRPSCLREVLTGGSSVPKPVVDAIRASLGASVATAWGMTETMSCSTYERVHPESSAGKPIPLIELALGESVATEQSVGVPPGRLMARGAFVVGETDSHGWCRTNDIATIDSQGVLTLRDRETDLIKSGGEWIASVELEQQLCKHPDVISAVVVGVDDPRWVERPYAYVTLKRGKEEHNNINEELVEYILERFPKWWVPDKITILDELPQTLVGKVDKNKIRLLANSNK